MEATNGVGAVRHVGIVVSDMERSVRFYRDVLGLTPTTTLEESGNYVDTLLSLQHADVLTVKLAAPRGEAVVELLQFKSHPDRGSGLRPIYAIGPSHIAFDVADVDRLYRRLSQAGVRCNAAPVRSPNGECKVVCCQDPDGVTIELVEVMAAPRRTALREASGP